MAKMTIKDRDKMDKEWKVNNEAISHALKKLPLEYQKEFHVHYKKYIYRL
jgi:hypothetical protein